MESLRKKTGSKPYKYLYVPLLTHNACKFVNPLNYMCVFYINNEAISAELIWTRMQQLPPQEADSAQKTGIKFSKLNMLTPHRFALRNILEKRMK